MTVLVVDDDPNVVEVFGRMLRLGGYDVLAADNAEGGLRIVETSSVDAILIDLRLPLVDGLAFVRRLRAHETRRRTPIAMVTGDYLLDDGIKNELCLLDVPLYFKPLWIDDLVRIVERLLDNEP